MQNLYSRLHLCVEKVESGAYNACRQRAKFVCYLCDEYKCILPNWILFKNQNHFIYLKFQVLLRAIFNIQKYHLWKCDPENLLVLQHCGKITGYETNFFFFSTVLWMMDMLADFPPKFFKPSCKLPLNVYNCKLLSSPRKTSGAPPGYATICVLAEPCS